MKLEFYNKKIESNSLPMVVDFWAPWCRPCKAMTPLLEEVAKEYSGKVDLWKINVDENPEIARTLGIMSIPTTIAYASGKMAFKKTGFLTKADIERMFQGLSEGKTPITSQISMLNRVLRLAAGTGLVFLGINFEKSIPLIILGAVLAFTAVYDRCPVYKAVSDWIKSHFSKKAAQ